MGGSVPDLNNIGVYPAEPQLAAQFRREVASLIGRENTHFPGAQPVSFARKHLRELKTRDYYVCEKSDGIRCLLYCTREGDGEIHYLIDRKNDFYFVPGLHFPLAAEGPGQDIDWASFHVDTLLDGELLYDEYPTGEYDERGQAKVQRILKYLVFDCLVLDGQNLMRRTLDKRLAYFMDKIHKPYRELCKRFPEDAAHFKFQLQKKDFQFGYGTEMMFKEVLPKLPHGSDGLIFTCKETPYKFGTDENILKWKPADENTVDFKLELEFPPPSAQDGMADRQEEVWDFDYDAQPKMTLHVSHGHHDDRPYATLFATTEEWGKMKSWAIDHNDGLEGQVIECHKDSQNRWRFNRFREDKKEANHVSVVEKVLESIEDGVTKEELIHIAGEVRHEWKRRQAERDEEENRRRMQHGGQPGLSRRDTMTGA